MDRAHNRRVALAFLLALLLLWPARSRAGGPLLVAGTSGFDQTVAGQPLLWKNGAIFYYTDPGKLGMLSHGDADALVAEMFSRWSAVPTAAVRAARAGALDEDVSGANVALIEDALSLPTDTLPTATQKPIAIVYDDDGQVTETLLGAGASDPIYCVARAAYGGPDAFALDATYTHALVVINGRCAQSASQLPALRYSLLRVLGRVLGLGWSQANDNVRTGDPPPSGQDLEGIPIMHPYPVLCGPGFPGGCWPSADQLRMDDRASLSRLYPVTASNLPFFPGKTVTAAATIRIRGSVRFSKTHIGAGQAMQGVNVVARWVDPATNQPSSIYVASSVSGFLFRGDAGNPITGYWRPDGQRFDIAGSDNIDLAGFFDLGGLELPPGQTSGIFRIGFEPLNPAYVGNQAVGPDGVAAVVPSGTIAAVSLGPFVLGSDVGRDFVAAGSTLPMKDPLEPNDAAMAQPLPAVGEWWGAFDGYGDSDFFQFPGSPNSTFSLRITALGDDLLPARNKAQPVAGIWFASDPADAPPALFSAPFNSIRPGATELQALLQSADDFRIGFADRRGDGRPDLRYHVRVLYARRVVPARIPEDRGSTVVIEGVGFRRDAVVTIGGQSAPVRAYRPDRLVVDAPSFSQGSVDVEIADPTSGLNSRIFGALLYGGSGTDRLVDLSRTNPAVPIGADAPYPMRVRAEGEAGVPLSGLPVTFRVSPELSVLQPCGTPVCTVLSDEAGEAAATVSVRTSGVHSITASISSGAGATTTLNASTALSSVSVTPFLTLVASGTTMSIPITAHSLQNGAGVNGQPVQFLVSGQGASLSPASAITDSKGEVQTILQLQSLSAPVSVSACVSSGSVCGQASLQTVSPAQVMLRRVGTELQTAFIGGAMPAVIVRALAPGELPVRTGVIFDVVVTSPAGNQGCSPSAQGCDFAIPKIFSRYSGGALTDENGFVRYTPTVQSKWGPVSVFVTFSVASGTAPEQTAQIQVVGPQP